MSLYRARAAGSGGLAALVERLHALEGRVTPAFWEAFAEDTGGELERRRGAAEDAARAGQEGGAPEVARYVELLEACIERAPEVEWELRAPPAGAPPVPPGFGARPLADEAAVRALGKALGDLTFAAHQEVRERSFFGALHPPLATIVVCEEHDPPLRLEHRTEADGVSEVFTASARLSRSAPPFGLVARGGFSSALSRIGGKDAPLGGGAFGSSFRVKLGGEAEAARVLTPGVRRALLALTRFDVPELSLGGGLVSVVWRYAWDARPLRDALLVLRAVRGLRFREPLLVPT